MSDRPNIENFLENLAKVDADLLMRESDRGCVLMRVSDLENQLHAILLDWFRAASGLPSRHEKQLFDFTGPLGTFSSKILMARAMGLISAELYQDLQSLRALRNTAAHSSDAFSLSSPEARSLMSKMHYEFQKSRKVERYSMAAQDEPAGELHEAIMKGHGFVRFDKSNFILTAKLVDIELHKSRAVSGWAGERSAAMLDAALKTLSEKSQQGQTEK